MILYKTKTDYIETIHQIDIKTPRIFILAESGIIFIYQKIVINLFYSYR